MTSTFIEQIRMKTTATAAIANAKNQIPLCCTGIRLGIRCDLFRNQESIQRFSIRNNKTNPARRKAIHTISGTFRRGGPTVRFMLRSQRRKFARLSTLFIIANVRFRGHTHQTPRSHIKPKFARIDCFCAATLGTAKENVVRGEMGRPERCANSNAREQQYRYNCQKGYYDFNCFPSCGLAASRVGLAERSKPNRLRELPQ